MTKPQLQKLLDNMDSSEFSEIVLNMYSKSKEAKSLLEVYFNFNDIDKTVDELSKKIERCFRRNGSPMMSSPKLKDAKSHISNFKKLYPLAGKKILELRLKYSFYLAEWLSEFGGGEPSWEDSLVNVFDECCEYAKEEGLQESYLKELQMINNTLNRNYCELLEDSLSIYFNSKN